MTHIAFVNMQAHGHVNPTLALVTELARRGMRVSYAIPKEFEDVVRRAGAEPKVYQSSFEIPKTHTFPPDPKDIAMMPTKILNEGASVVGQLEELYKDDRPDLVCYDFMATAGRLFAHKLGIPAVRLNPSYAANESFSLVQRFMNIDPNDPGMQAYAARLAEVLTEQGLPVMNPRDFMLACEGLNIVFLPRAFHYEGQTFDERFLFVGPCLRETPQHESWTPKHPERPTLLISLGTVFNNWPEFFHMCMEAFGAGEWNVVMAIGANIDKESLGPIPDNFEVRAHVPQLAVLKTARAFLTHGGMGSTMEALSHGVPIVVIPQMMEQMATAMRVQELNLGRYLPRPDVTVGTLRHALSDVLADEAMKENVKAIGEEIRKAGGAARAVDGLLRYLNAPGS